MDRYLYQKFYISAVLFDAVGKCLAKEDLILYPVSWRRGPELWIVATLNALYFRSFILSIYFIIYIYIYSN